MDTWTRMDQSSQSIIVNRRQQDLLREAHEARVLHAVRAAGETVPEHGLLRSLRRRLVAVVEAHGHRTRVATGDALKPHRARRAGIGTLAHRGR